MPRIKLAARVMTALGLAAAAVLAGQTAAGDAHAANKEKTAIKVIARVNGEDVTKDEYDTAIKGNRRFFDLARESVRRRLDGKTWTEYVFDEEIVKVRAFAQSRATELPAMKEAIGKAMERVEAGEDFAKVAAEVSQDRGTAASGGSLGEPKAFFDLVHPFNRVAFSMKEGEVSDPVLTIFGYHIIKVEKILPAMEGKPKRVEVRHILVRFEGDPRQEAEESMAQAKVEILQQKPYCKRLPSYCEEG